MNLVDVPVTVAAVKSGTKGDPILSRVNEYTMKSWRNYTPTEILTSYFNKREGVDIDEAGFVIPPKLRLKGVATDPPDTLMDCAHEGSCSKLCVMAKI